MEIRKDSRKIDALVAEHVMGLYVYFSDGEYVDKDGNLVRDYRCREPEGSYRWFVDPYSTDIRAAWEVVEKCFLKERPECLDKHISEYIFSLNENISNESGKWQAGLGNMIPYEGFSFDDSYCAGADTPAMAICLAALRSKGIEY